MFITSTALADTWTVDDDGKADFDNIQAAVNAASDGDEIIVMPGTYTGDGDEVVDLLNKSLVLRSNGVSELTIIDGEHSRRGISVDDLSHLPRVIVIEGFTIINCSFSNNTGSGIGGGTTTSTININSCHFENNEGLYGGGLRLQGDVVSITNCTFSKNSAFGSGGGAACSGTNIEISECVFEGNIISGYGFGGGVSLQTSGKNTSAIIDNCLFNNNVSNLGDGGALGVTGVQNIDISNCSFNSNVSDYEGGGVWFWVTLNAHISNCNFEYNSSYYGGGLFAYHSEFTLDNCIFRENTAFSTGGAVYTWNHIGDVPTISNTIICGNSDEQVGGDVDEINYEWGNCIAESCNDSNGDEIPDECKCLADINGDGYVNISDLLIVIDQWGLPNSPADLNQDGIVDVSDLLIVVGNWGACE